MILIKPCFEHLIKHKKVVYYNQISLNICKRMQVSLLPTRKRWVSRQSCWGMSWCCCRFRCWKGRWNWWRIKHHSFTKHGISGRWRRRFRSWSHERNTRCNAFQIQIVIEIAATAMSPLRSLVQFFSRTLNALIDKVLIIKITFRTFGLSILCFIT